MALKHLWLHRRAAPSQSSRIKVSRSPADDKTTNNNDDNNTSHDEIHEHCMHIGIGQLIHDKTFRTSKILRHGV
eukprot:2540917-Amphidinium_carterae.2